MIDFLKKLFSKPKLENTSPVVKNTPPVVKNTRPDGFQAANANDSNFIFNLILIEAKNKHFNPEYLSPKKGEGLKIQILCAIKEYKIPTGNASPSASAIYVYIDNNKPVGFSWVVERETHGEQELYLLAVSQSHRKRGIGKDLVLGTISKFPSKTKFSARLYPTSQGMLKILNRIEFKPTKIRGSNMTHLSYTSK